MKAATKKPRLTYRSLEEDPSYEHVVDKAVRLRVGRRDLVRTIADSTDAIVKALGRRRKLWFDFESAADETRVKREAAYFDAGVEHGITAARVHALAAPSKTVRARADRVARAMLATGVNRDNAIRAAIVAAWAVLIQSQPVRLHLGPVTANDPNHGESA